MREYVILPLDAPFPTLTGREFHPEKEGFCRREFAAIDSYVWAGEYRPEARAYMARGEDALHVLLCAREETILCAAKEFNGAVWRDSCLECFIQPFQDDPRYMNIETNAAGAVLMAIGAGRNDRRFLQEQPEGMGLSVSKHMGAWWAVAYRIPYALLERLYGKKPDERAAMRGNFYCCDETLHPHFGSWNPIDHPTPDFHRPEDFGLLVPGR